MERGRSPRDCKSGPTVRAKRADRPAQQRSRPYIRSAMNDNPSPTDDHIAEAVATRDAFQTASLGQCWDAKQAKRLSAIAQDAPSRLKRVYCGTASPRECNKVFCLECVWMDEKAIRECTATACPLYRLRPYQGRPS